MDHCPGLRVSLCNFECAEVFFARVALVNSSEDIHVLVLRVGNPSPRQFHGRGFNVLQLQGDVKFVQVCNINEMNTCIQEYPC